MQRNDSRASRACQAENSNRANLFVPGELARSRAFLSLSGRSPQVLLVFYTKRQVKKAHPPNPRGNLYRITNNGQLVFPYREAEQDYGLTTRMFTRALDQLVTMGFLDIAKQGGGLQGDCSRYALSERWRLYGTPDFKDQKRPKAHPRSAHINVRAPAHKKVRALPQTERAHKCARSIEQSKSSLSLESVSLSSGVVVSSGVKKELSNAPRSTPPSTRRRKSPAKPTTDPRIRVLIDGFYDAYKKAHGRAYVVSGAKDGKLLKRLLAALDAEKVADPVAEIMKAAETMLADPWGKPNAGIGLLSSQFNKWRGGLQKPTPPGQRPSSSVGLPLFRGGVQQPGGTK